MLRPEWRIWPLTSCLGILDLKTAVSVALFFAIFNKVAGVYGLIAVATGAGGSFSQLSLYIYSVVALVALVWGVQAVKEEDPKKTLYFAHLFFADHIFSTSWTVYFAVLWWFHNPHDGQHTANSPAQIEIIEGTVHSNIPMSDKERAAASLKLWNQEKGTAAAFIIISWLIKVATSVPFHTTSFPNVFKIYLALLIYSYASHLRKGTYRSLLRSRAPASTTNNNDTYDSALGYPEEDEGLEDLYRFPPRTPNSAVPNHDARKSKPTTSAQNAEVLFDQERPSGSRTQTAR
ncbi:hypothetical protein AAF712_005817 [Marasmius tenuissimus]|uniref:DUF1753-domain-containing protein n=1 Tax=Marasmius tenuissimus TaxID=585030 RepID=A0ABR2ZZW9_9AGAR